MKKILLFLFIGAVTQLQAQCPVTVAGGGTICPGSCTVLQASGCNNYTWTAGPTASAYTVCPSSTMTFTVTGAINTCTSTATVTVYVDPPLTLTPTFTTPTCGQCNGTASVMTSGGTPAYAFSWAPNGSTVQAPSGLCAGIYTCTVIDAYGCNTTSVVPLSNSTGPNATFTMVPNGVPHVWDVTASYSGGSPPYTYDWDWGDGSTHDVTQYPSHTYSVAAFYNICLTLTDGNGCVSTSCQNDSLYKTSSWMITVNVINNTTAVHTKTSPAFQLAPNPASTQITVDAGSAKPATIRIFDLSGTEILVKNISGKTTLDISEVPEGIYTISCKTDDKQIAKKLVIVR